MVEMLLKGFAAEAENAGPNPAPIICYHVDARFSTGMEDIAQPRAGKLVNLFKYVAQAIWIRVRHGVRFMYYAPAPPLKAPLYRDIIILTLLKPFFPRRAFYWHAAGLGEWLPTLPSWLQRLAHFALDGADITMSPSSFGLPDAKVFNPKNARVVPYGVPDPFPDYESRIAPRRAARIDELKKANGSGTRVNLLFMALLTEEKGLLDALRALKILRDAATPYDFHLTVAGKFLNPTEEQKFHNLVRDLSLVDAVAYAGFVSGAQKSERLLSADVYIFPTWYYAESAPLVLFEAMAAGLPIVTTAWRSLPEFFAPAYPGVVPINSPKAVAEATLTLLQREDSTPLRQRFLAAFRLDRHLANLRAALELVGPQE